MTCGVEYQDHVWIGELSNSRRVLLGYHSGHHSRPALRVQEVAWLAEATDDCVSNLLWLTASYLEKGVRPVALATTLCSKIPGLRPNRTATIVDALFENTAVDSIQWNRDSNLGWVNNGKYSQRNTNSRLSILNA